MKIQLFPCALATSVACVLIACGCAGMTPDATGGSQRSRPTVSATSPKNGDGSASTTTLITATFSEPMDANSLTTESFYATASSGPLAGTVTCVGDTATLRLTNPMPINTLVTATITVAVRDKESQNLASPYTWKFTTGAGGDTTRPTVSSTSPANGTTGVSINKSVIVVFSEPMAADSVNNATFKVGSVNGPIPGTVSLQNNVATFNPTNNFVANKLITATVTTGAKDLSGNALAANKVWSFTTGNGKDTTAPTVTSTDPASSAVNVPVNKSVSAVFSEDMDATTINSSNLMIQRVDGSVVPTTVAYANKVAVLNPTGLFAANTLYTATVKTGVTDTAGNSLASVYKWTFKTASGGDSTKPTVLSTNPASGAMNVFLNKSVNATFSEAMMPDSLNTSTFHITGVSGTVSYNTISRIGTFKPISDLLPNTVYTAFIETGAKDAAGNGLLAQKKWTFKTGVQRSQANIDLGSASNYAVLAGSTVTNSGLTIVNGDLGVSPGTAVTGFPPGKVNGAIHAGDAQAAQAKSDLLAGQLDAAGRLGAATLPGDISGLTFTPGLYKNASSVKLSTGNVTLDALGDSDAVFVFQMGTTLTTLVGTHVILAGGAQASNIYWSVGSSATFGVNSTFKGIVLSEVSITMNTGAVNDGNLLTKTGAVTLEANTLTRVANRQR